MPKALNGYEEFHIDRDGAVVGSASTRDIAVWGAGFWNGALSFSDATVGAALLKAAEITGMESVYLTRTGSTGAYNDTTDTAANIIAALTAKLGQIPAGLSYVLRIINGVAFVDTITGGTGVTISGTATVPASGFRDFLVKVTGPTTVTMTSIGSGTN
ncbi:hypothetical protein QZN01_20765 [Burkholderia cenocepacia]|uniref:hypothetical protein n=1 Tax=Burkholderia cenocepacia TaxID=95486 RepID=UPI002653920F|nr:hypothetical protein [Burkholderia cenocepacia]MDN7825088.1 hypothetical protein [Burkholderia cenocepacia]